MIYDSLKYAGQYAALHPQFPEAFAFLEKARDLAPGRYDLSEGMYAIVEPEGNTRNGEGALFEAHRQYIDVQMLIKGRSRVEWALTENLTVEKPFQPEKDYEGLSGTGRFFEAQPFDFYVLYPNDAHKPHCFFAQESEPFQVVIVKIPVQQK